MWRSNGLGTVAREVAVSQIVGNDQNDVRRVHVDLRPDALEIGPMPIDPDVGISLAIQRA